VLRVHDEQEHEPLQEPEEGDLDPDLAKDEQVESPIFYLVFCQRIVGEVKNFQHRNDGAETQHVEQKGTPH